MHVQRPATIPPTCNLYQHAAAPACQAVGAMQCAIEACNCMVAEKRPCNLLGYEHTLKCRQAPALSDSNAKKQTQSLYKNKG